MLRKYTATGLPVLALLLTFTLCACDNNDTVGPGPDSGADIDAGSEVVPSCEESDEAVVLDTGNIEIVSLAASKTSDRALVVYAVASTLDPSLFASVFDGSEFSAPVEIAPPPGISFLGAGVSACFAGPMERPIVALGGTDAQGHRNLMAVGDATGTFMTPVLVEDEPMDGAEYSAPYLVCSATRDRAVVSTTPATGTIWVDAWTGSSMLGPQQVVDPGWSAAVWDLSGFNQGDHVIAAYLQTNETMTSAEVKGLVFSDVQWGSPSTLYTGAFLSFMRPTAAVAPLADRGLVVFPDEEGGLQAVRVTGDSFSARTALTDPGTTTGLGRIHFFRAVDRAAIVSETSAGAVQVVIDNGADFGAPVSIGTKYQGAGMHNSFTRFYSSPTSAEAFVLFDGDAQGNEVISLVPFDGTSFLAPVTLTDSAEYITAHGGYASSGDAALFVFETMSEQDGVRAYGRVWADGALRGAQRIDCGIPNHGMGDFQVIPAWASDRFGVYIGHGGAGEEGTQLRVYDDTVPTTGTIFPLGEAVALYSTDGILVVSVDGQDLIYEVR